MTVTVQAMPIDRTGGTGETGETGEAARSTPPLRVGIVCFSTFGGSGVVATEIGLALARRGHTVHLFSDEVPARLAAQGDRVTFHPVVPPRYPQLRYPPYTLALASKLVEVCRGDGLDIVHAHYALPHAVSAQLARQVLTAEPSDAPVPKIVTTLHGTDITLVGSDPSFLPLTRLAIISSDAITTPSSWLARATRGTLSIPAAVAIDVVPNFVDTTRFSPAPAPDAVTSRARRPTIVHVSNFRPLKRLDDVIAVFATLRERQPVRLSLVGDGPERPRVEAAIAARGLTQDVALLGEQVDLPAVLRASDVFLLPSATESFGLAALEALACGVPVVASDVGGLREVITDGEVGFLRPVGDVHAMAEAVGRLLGDGELRDQMGQAGRRRALSCFALAPAVDRYLAIYRRALARA